MRCARAGLRVSMLSVYRRWTAARMTRPHPERWAARGASCSCGRIVAGDGDLERGRIALDLLRKKCLREPHVWPRIPIFVLHQINDVRAIRCARKLLDVARQPL